MRRHRGPFGVQTKINKSGQNVCLWIRFLDQRILCVREGKIIKKKKWKMRKKEKKIRSLGYRCSHSVLTWFFQGTRVCCRHREIFKNVFFKLFPGFEPGRLDSGDQIRLRKWTLVVVRLGPKKLLFIKAGNLGLSVMLLTV